MFCSWFYVVVVVLCFYFYFKLFSFSFALFFSHSVSFVRSVCALTPAIYLHAFTSVSRTCESNSYPCIRICIRIRIRCLLFVFRYQHIHIFGTQNIQFIKFYFPPEITLTVFHSRVFVFVLIIRYFKVLMQSRTSFDDTIRRVGMLSSFYPLLSRDIYLLFCWIHMRIGVVAVAVGAVVVQRLRFLFLLIFIVIGWHNWTTLYKLVIALKAVLLNATIWL